MVKPLLTNPHCRFNLQSLSGEISIVSRNTNVYRSSMCFNEEFASEPHRWYSQLETSNFEWIFSSKAHLYFKADVKVGFEGPGTQSILLGIPTRWCPPRYNWIIIPLTSSKKEQPWTIVIGAMFTNLATLEAPSQVCFPQFTRSQETPIWHRKTEKTWVLHRAIWKPRVHDGSMKQADFSMCSFF